MTCGDLELRGTPFDALADAYDQAFTESVIGQTQRSAVWVELEKAFYPGEQILEIGCGTGVDACFLAERGINVLASDASPAMIRVASDRVRERARYFASASVKLSTWPAERIAAIRPNRQFDGAFSNFGALNCIEDLRGVARALASRVRPAGKALLCLLGPCCLWEVAWFLAHRQPGRAVRRFRPSGTTAEFPDGSKLQVFYPTVDSLARTFAPEFRLRAIKGIGISVPPSYAAVFISRFPRILKLSERWDRRLAGCPGLRVLGDHILVTFERATS